MWRSLAFSSLVVLTACQPESDAPCAMKEATYSVTAQVSLSDQVTERKTAGVEPRVLASVWQSSTVTSCSGDLVSVTSPGAALVETRPVSVDSAGFTLRFSESLHPQLDAPELGLEVLLDENGNGRCDDGEPSGQVAVPRSLRAHVRVELTPAACRLRL
ncbi:MAG TPA: hypothetical protein VFZ61_29230 [Polyangiales bacterium]